MACIQQRAFCVGINSREETPHTSPIIYKVLRRLPWVIKQPHSFPSWPIKPLLTTTLTLPWSSLMCNLSNPRPMRQPQRAMLHTGTGNDLQPSNDFLKTYELCRQRPGRACKVVLRDCIPFRRPLIPLLPLVSSSHLVPSCLTLWCLLESSLEQLTEVLATVLRTHPLPKMAARPGTVPCGWRSSKRSSSVAVPPELL